MKLPISITIHGEQIHRPIGRTKLEFQENNVSETVITLRGHYYKNTTEFNGDGYFQMGFEINFDEGTMTRWTCSESTTGIEKQRECLEYRHGVWYVASTQPEAA